MSKYHAGKYDNIVLSPAKQKMEGPIAYNFEPPIPFKARNGEIDPRTIPIWIGPKSQVRKAIGEMFEREAAKDAELITKKLGGRK